MSGLVLVLLWSVCPQALPLKGWAGRAESQFTCTQADVGLGPSLETPPCAHADLALPLGGPERLVEEAVVIGTRPMIQEGLRMKQPKGVLGTKSLHGQTPSQNFWFVRYPHCGQRKESWRKGGVRGEMPLPMHVWVGLCPPKDRPSPLSSTCLYPGLKLSRDYSTITVALVGFPCYFLGEKADFCSKHICALLPHGCYLGMRLLTGCRIAPYHR